MYISIFYGSSPYDFTKKKHVIIDFSVLLQGVWFLVTVKEVFVQ